MFIHMYIYMCVFFFSWACRWTIPSLSVFNIIIVIMYLICIKFLLYLHVFVCPGMTMWGPGDTVVIMVSISHCCDGG